MTKLQEIRHLKSDIGKLDMKHVFSGDKYIEKTTEQLASDKEVAEEKRERLRQLRKEVATERQRKRDVLMQYADTLRAMMPHVQGYQRTALAVAVALFEGTKDAGIKRAIKAVKQK